MPFWCAVPWRAGQRAAALLSAAPFAATMVLTSRIRWFDRGAQTNTAQHHHAWVLVDYGDPPAGPPALRFADKRGAGPLVDA